MVPVFNRGDAVIYEKLSEEQLKKIEIYTIIVYSREEQLIVHRVIDKWETNGKTYYLTKGDANKSDDYVPVGTDQIVGIYKFAIKYIGYPSVWLSEAFKKENSY